MSLLHYRVVSEPHFAIAVRSRSRVSGMRRQETNVRIAMESR